MRIALISDIHGNLVSLDAVLRDIEQESVDRLICLGDVATLGPQPHEVIALLQTLDCDFIKGNHEVDVLDPDTMEAVQAHPQEVMESVRWCSEQLSESERDFLESFQPTVSVTLDEKNSLLCFHGSPGSNTDIITTTTPRDTLDTLFNGHEAATVMAGGHTHVQMLRLYYKYLIINPGSVGEPLMKGRPGILPWAEYAIINAENGDVRLDFRRVPVDLDAIRDACAGTSNPLNWADRWIEPEAL